MTKLIPKRQKTTSDKTFPKEMQKTILETKKDKITTDINNTQ